MHLVIQLAFQNVLSQDILEGCTQSNSDSLSSKLSLVNPNDSILEIIL